MDRTLRPSMMRFIITNIVSTLFFTTLFVVLSFLFNYLNQQRFISLITDLLSYQKVPNSAMIAENTFPFLTGLFFILAIYVIIKFIIRIIIFQTIYYSVTNDLIVKYIGLLGEKKVSIPTNEITNIQFTKSWLLDKLFNTGNLFFYTAGSNSYDTIFKYVSNPQKEYENINYILGYETSEEINERGDIVNSQGSNLQKRLKPIPIIPALGGLIGAPIFFIFTGMGIPIFLLIGSLINSNALILIFLGVLISIFLIALWLGGIYITYLSYKRRYYDFYKNKIEFYDGFFNRRKATIAMERITNISNSQSLFGRIFNFHKIIVETAGSSSSQIKISYIRDGDKIVDELKEVLKLHGRN